MPNWMDYIAAIKATTLGPVFLPSNASGLVVWLDAQSGVYSDSSFSSLATNTSNVGGWRDRSTFGNDVTMSNTLNQPIFVNSVIGVNSVVRFDGLTSYLSSSVASFMDVPQFTFFSVIIRAATANIASMRILKLNNDSAGRVFAITADSFGVGNKLAFVKGGVLTVGSSNASILVSATPIVLSVNYNATGTCNIYINNSLNITINSATVPTFSIGSNLTIGAQSSGAALFKGDVAEVILYNSVLSSTSQNSVANYLASKYFVW